VRCLNRMHETNPLRASPDGADWRSGHLPGRQAGGDSPPRGHGVSAPESVPTMSIYDNVGAGLKLNGYSNRRVLDEIVERSLKEAALWDEVKDDLKKKSGASLSGGQQQRLCIARALRRRSGSAADG